MRAPYSVTITQVDDRSLLVQVGCKTLAYPIRDLEHFLADLALYITDPEHAIKAMSERHGWATGEVQETELTKRAVDPAGRGAPLPRACSWIWRATHSPEREGWLSR